MTDRDADQTLPRDLSSVAVEVGHYRILKRIGAGGMGEVFLAEDTKLHRRVALKFLPPSLTDDADLRTRFLREARAAAQLDHPNIVTIHEIGEFEGRPYIAMQYIAGRPLSDLRTDSMTISHAVQLACGICEGLANAHAAKITHRDIKPANILVREDLRPVLLDFGLANLQGDEKLTRAGSTVGTFSYMSPEQAQGLEVDPRSDLFSFGIVLYELIAGRPPFRRENEAATLNAIVMTEPEPLARYKNDVPPELQRVVSKCLAKNPNQRYPSAADLLVDLRALDRELASGATSSSRVAASQPSLAVLPFANMSADPENEFFSDGLTEELLNTLAKNPGLKVTGRTSSFAFKGKQEDLRGIGQKLGVGTLLEGSVRKAGNRLRITAQLVNASDGFHLWSQTYDRVLDDVFALQDEIARSVADALNVKLLGKREEPRAVNPESYELLLRANQSAQQGSKSSVAVAVDLYRKAIDLDPVNGRAWAGLARAYTYQVAFGHSVSETLVHEAKQAVERALDLDDQLPEAYDVRCWVLSALELRFAEGAAAIRKAHALAPNQPRVLATLALVEAMSERFDEALHHSKRAIELDPLNPDMHLQRGRVLFWAGRAEQAEQTFRRILELSPGLTSANSLLSLSLVLQGRAKECLEVLRREESTGYRACGEAIAYHSLGMKHESDRALAKLIEHGNSWSFQVAGACAWRREVDRAFEWLENSIAVRDTGVGTSRVHPLLRSMHSDPRWTPLLERIGLVG